MAWPVVAGTAGIQVVSFRDGTIEAMQMLKRIAGKLPAGWQAELKRLHYSRQIRRGEFTTDEREFGLLDSLVKPGDWVLDVGANVGHYTARLSALVGTAGRVIAFEPVPETFALLAANARLFAHPNVTLVNVAASDRTAIVGMSIPVHGTGLSNYYEAHICAPGTASLAVMTLCPDALLGGASITLAKVDAEGHEGQVLAGMRGIIERCRPTLIIETWSDALVADVVALGYAAERLKGSSNVLFRSRS